MMVSSNNIFIQTSAAIVYIESFRLLCFQDVVGQLWFSFLRAKKVAFCDEEPEILSIRDRSHTGRNKKVGLLPLSIKRKRGLVAWTSDDEDDDDDNDEFNQSKEESSQSSQNVNKGTDNNSICSDNESIQDFLNLGKGTSKNVHAETYISNKDIMDLEENCSVKTQHSENEFIQDKKIHRNIKVECVDEKPIQNHMNSDHKESSNNETEMLDSVGKTHPRVKIESAGDNSLYDIFDSDENVESKIKVNKFDLKLGINFIL